MAASAYEETDLDTAHIFAEILGADDLMSPKVPRAPVVGDNARMLRYGIPFGGHV